MKTRDVFGRRSPLLIDQYELTTLNKHFTEQSGTYKPILPLPQSPGEEWLNTIPDDLQGTVDRQMHPHPKFGSYQQSNDSN